MVRRLFPALILLTAITAGAARQEPIRILLVIDASASMSTAWSGHGGDRFGAVRTALDTVTPLIEGLKNPPDIALRVFGADSTPIDPDACGDTHRVLDWNSQSDTMLAAALDDLSPRGSAPLVRALESARSDLGTPGPNDLVLIIVDGADLCGGEAGAALAALTADGEGAEVHVFGFSLDPIDEAALSEADFHPVLWPAQLVQGMISVFARRLSIPAEESSVVLKLADSDTWPEAIVVQGSWNKDPIPVNPRRTPLLFSASPGTATITATSEDGREARLTRVPVVPDEPLRLSLGSPVRGELSVSLTESGWGVAPALVIEWEGFDPPPERLILREPGTPGASWLRAEPVDGSQGRRTVPVPHCGKEISVQLRARASVGVRILAETTIVLDDLGPRLRAESTAEPGSSVELSWEGPSFPGDLVTLVPADAAPEEISEPVDAVAGPPIDFFTPIDPCRYEFRYIDGRSFRVIARTPLEVSEPRARLKAPETIVLPQTLEVHWWGPALPGEVITLAHPDDDPTTYVDWADPGGGSPARLQPTTGPGTFEVRYVDREGMILASQTVEVEEAQVVLEVPKTATVGGRIRFRWTGPAGPKDFLVLIEPGRKLSKRLDFAFASEGSPTSLAAPRRPGLYEIRYIEGSSLRELAKATIRIVP